ncbi:MAG: ABC transporter permease subunit [Anaerolineales bacterium]|jgi:ABC-2 type transport system permease protein
MNKINTILRKEWSEVFKNRMVLFTVAFLPLILTAIPLVIIYFSGTSEDFTGMTSDIPGEFNALCPSELSGGDCFQVFIVSQFMIMFMIIPLAIPSSISAYSIVGEKINRSLEPLLATPITTAELLIGKSLAAIIPALAATWIGFGIFILGTWIMISNPVVIGNFLDLRWIIAIFIIGPLMALSAVSFSIIVSSRVNDPRVAEQVSMIIILPVLAAFFGQMAGIIILNTTFMIASALVLGLVDLVLVYLSVRLFQRETIITRWK